MNFTLNETVPYAACIIMEIYEDKGQYFVKVSDDYGNYYILLISKCKLFYFPDFIPSKPQIQIPCYKRM